MSKLTRPTTVELEGVGKVTLRERDYVTAGGEGVIYRKGDHIIKLTHDPQQFVATDMPAKLRLLKQSLAHPSIVVPRGVVLDRRGTPVGMHMPYVDGEPFPRLFTTSWQRQNHFDNQASTALATVMRDVVTHTHSAGALLVDANELNWLADVSDIRQPIPYIIDVDSWQIGHFPGTAIMPSIRDWHTAISEASDWFAWGVVTFLLYTGIHPYKGKLVGYQNNELERRMREQASVFRPEVKLNQAVRDFANIPGPLLDWYRATFEEGERTTPPSPQQTGVATTTVGRTLRAVTTHSGGLHYEQLLRILGTDIVSVWPCGVVLTSDQRLVNVRTQRTITTMRGSRAAVVERAGGYLIAEAIGDTWQFRFVSAQGVESMLSLDLPITEVIRNGERLFVHTGDTLAELILHTFSRPLLTVDKRWAVPTLSSSWLSGFGVADYLGAMHLVIPYGEQEVALVRARELDGKRVIHGIGLEAIATVVTVDKDGAYQAITFSGRSGWRTYQVTNRDIDGPELNQTVLPKGVTAQIDNDGELTIVVPSSGVSKQVVDKDLLSTMQLSRIGNQVVYRQAGALWSLRMT